MTVEYYNTDDLFDITPRSYSDWVEGKIMTSGTDRLPENVLGLVGEAGEVAEKVKKHIRDKKPLVPEDIAKELGDVIFYVAAIGNLHGYSLQSIINLNVEKLNSRQSRGVLGGSGDNR